ncbi:MAG: cation:proton antiporter [Candidatus Reconcilbacillus cellulovorans]|uniref:Cation:proton antiporter n=1 Tax=Candidatus Reconcilbacillus cellulovorans TaxID=1906605 RepID=A0A2A6DWU4_9BACL|nr:MAG: cation:proton antiporter [Candidatus Reconcilbacillus cellulovorans]
MRRGEKPLMFLTRFSLKNALAVAILAVLAAVGGLYASSQFKQEAMPDVSIPYLFVTSFYPGATPEEVRAEVAEPLEQALRNIRGVQTVLSTAASNVATVTLEFSFDADLDEKKREVEEALAGVRLPQEAEKPQVTKLSFESGPMMYTAVSAGDGVSEQELAAFVRDRVLPALQGLEGVGRVQVLGLPPERVDVRLLPDKMAEKGVTYQQVRQVLQAMNVTLPVGEATFDRVKRAVVLTGRARTVDELKKLVVQPMPEVRLADIADISEGEAEPDTITRVQGNPAVAVNIVRNIDANTVDVSDRVREKLSELFEGETGFKLDIVYDAAVDVKRSVRGMLREGLLGALFASLLILLFLRNGRATLIAVVSIPLSVLIALMLLKAFTDVTLNIMTLGGMAVAIGRVVDDSIVVIENIVRRLQHRGGGTPGRELFFDATREVGGAITSSTLTTVAVFAPLGLVGGMIGKIFAPFALTVVLSLLSSLLVAVTVVPAMAYAMLRRGVKEKTGAGRVAAFYRRMLDWSLKHKAATLLLAFLLFTGSLALVPFVGVTFIPEPEEKFAVMTLTMPKGTDVRAVDEAALRIDEQIRRLPEVRLSLVTSGSPEGEFDPNTLAAGESHRANWVIGLDPDTDVDAFVRARKADLQPPAEGATIDVQKLAFGPGGPGIYVVVTAKTRDDLRRATETIAEAVRSVPGTENVRHTLVDDLESVRVTVRSADALRNGLSTAQAWAMLRPLFADERVGKIGEGGRTLDVVLSVGGAAPKSAADIANLPLLSPLGRTVALGDIADVATLRHPAAIQLRNGQEYAAVVGNIADPDTGKVNAELRRKLEALSLPEGASYSLDGSNKQINDMMRDMSMAMLAAVGLVYVVMLVTFGEGRAPFAILFSLPFAAVGALAGTFVAGEPISVASMVGMLMLIGIVVTNAIVLVDRVQKQIAAGLSVREALLEAGGTRLRPILMTAIATICALAPLALGWSEGALVSKGLAVVVIGGLTTSTLLTLLVVPVMYELLHGRRGSRLKAEAGTAG